MKKSLLALAALSTIAGAAQAQSSVTLFGALDAGGYYANQVLAKTAAAPSNSGAFGVLGNTIVSSNWGLKGTEDLGGGLKANFYAESGINPRNGTLSQAGQEVSAPIVSPTITLFDRGLYVGVQGANWGAVNVGNKLNPFYAAAAGIVPVGGNSVTTNAAQAGGYFLPFVHNSISYQLPTMAGFNAAVQYGAGNAVNDSSAGSVTAGSLSYATGGLTLTAAGQYLASKGTQVSANNIGATYSGNPSVNGSTANGSVAAYGAGVSTAATSPSVGTYLLGAKYNAGAFTIGAGFVANQVGQYTGSTIVNASGTGTPKTSYRAYSLNQYQVGVGYQATPAVLLGLTWVGATSGSNLINAQARYAFSKRTQAYAQLGYAINNAGLGLNVYNGGNMTALAGSGGASFGGANAAVAAPNFNQAAFGVGLIHTF
jgi:GBP family porin